MLDAFQNIILPLTWSTDALGINDGQDSNQHAQAFSTMSVLVGLSHGVSARVRGAYCLHKPGVEATGPQHHKCASCHCMACI